MMRDTLLLGFVGASVLAFGLLTYAGNVAVIGILLPLYLLGFALLGLLASGIRRWWPAGLSVGYPVVALALTYLLLWYGAKASEIPPTQALIETLHLRGAGVLLLPFPTGALLAYAWRTRWVAR